MDDELFRRTVALPAPRKADLNQIKGNLGIKTDTAAIDHAIKQTAKLASRSPGEVLQALALLDFIQNEVQSGNSVVIEKKPKSPDGEPERERLVLLGSVAA